MPSITLTPPHDAGNHVIGEESFDALEKVQNDPQTPPRSTAKKDIIAWQSTRERTNQDIDPAAERERQERYDEEWRVYLGLD